MLVRDSKYSFEETVDRLSAAIRSAGNTVFATIDQTQAAVAVGMSLRPTVLILFGNPRGGTPLMDAFPAFALELPLKLLVWEQDGTTKIGHASMAELAQRYGVTGKDAAINAMDRALETLVSAVA